MNLEKHNVQRKRWAAVKYHFDEACFSVMEPDEIITSEELQSRLSKKYRIKFGSPTIAKIIHSLEIANGISPVNTYYQVNPEYLDKIGKHRKSNSRKWKEYSNNDENIL